MKSYMPILINDSAKVSIYRGLLKGTMELLVTDNGSDVFTATAQMNTSKTSESAVFLLSGNQNISIRCCGMAFDFLFSKWTTSKEKVSFHLQAYVQKGIVEKIIFNKGLSANRSVVR